VRLPINSLSGLPQSIQDGLRHACTTVLSPFFGSFYTLCISLILCLYNDSSADFPARSNLASLSPWPSSGLPTTCIAAIGTVFGGSDMGLLERVSNQSGSGSGSGTWGVGNEALTPATKDTSSRYLRHTIFSELTTIIDTIPAHLLTNPTPIVNPKRHHVLLPSATLRYLPKLVMAFIHYLVRAQLESASFCERCWESSVLFVKWQDKTILISR
jgi:hypothetical protein